MWPWLKVKRKGQSPGARGPWVSPFPTLGLCPHLRSRAAGWASVRTLLGAGEGTQGKVEGPELGRHPSSHGERLYVAHTGFSNLKHELSFKHPRSLPQNPGFLLLCKKNSGSDNPELPVCHLLTSFTVTMWPRGSNVPSTPNPNHQEPGSTPLQKDNLPHNPSAHALHCQVSDLSG